MNVYPISNELETTWNLFLEESVHCVVGHNIVQILSVVRHIFVNIFGSDTINAHTVLGVLPTNGNPQTQRTNAIIFLYLEGASYFQHIYQFAHELCHFMVPDEVCQSYRWFEETLCQMMSWYAMQRMYESRRTNRLQNFDQYYERMPRYIAESQADRIPLGDMSLSGFIQKNFDHLTKECYDRAMNRTIGFELYPLFLENPGLWKIVPLLHTLTDDLSLPDALAHICRSLGTEESGCDQLIDRLTK